MEKGSYLSQQMCENVTEMFKNNGFVKQRGLLISPPTEKNIQTWRNFSV